MVVLPMTLTEMLPAIANNNDVQSIVVHDLKHPTVNVQIKQVNK